MCASGGWPTGDPFHFGFSSSPETQLDELVRHAFTLQGEAMRIS